MISYGSPIGHRQKVRRELLGQYVQLQRELAGCDAGTSTYQVTIHAFRQIGYALISAGFEDDLDRLLRIRVLDGGRSEPAPTRERAVLSGFFVVEGDKQHAR